MDVNKQFYIKQTTHTTRARVDSIRYKVNVNTMEQSSVDDLVLNEIGRVVFTTGKELFFDPYRRNKQTGSFILIDPITNNVLIGSLSNSNNPISYRFSVIHFTDTPCRPNSSQTLRIAS